MPITCTRMTPLSEALLERHQVCEAFFDREAHRLAQACRLMSERFLAGGRLIAFGRGPYATDARHVSVQLLTSVAQPILLAPAAVGLWRVASYTNELGVMPPYTPLQHFTGRRCGGAVSR